MMATSTMDKRTGFALVELLIAMAVVAIVGMGLVSLAVSQATFTNHQDALRNARASANGALNMLMSEMRMLEATGGVEIADSQSIQVRLPIAFGLVCGTSGGTTTLNLLPTDSATLAEAAPSGYAVKIGGAYTYRDTLNASSGTQSVCDADSISTVTGGRVIDVTPSTTANVGSSVFLYQTVLYEFKESAVFSNRFALWRTAVESGATEEISSPFDSTSVFRFYVDAADTSQAAPPADLGDLTGFEFNLVGESELPAKGEREPTEFELNATVRFKNGN